MTSQRIDSSARDRRSVASVLRRLRVLLVAAALLIAGSPPAMATYWNVFNIEGERALSAQIVTYATLADMLGDVNRTGVFTPNPLGFGVNIVGSGADILVAPPPPGAIPEPATIGLLGSALLTLALARRRRVIGVKRSG